MAKFEIKALENGPVLVPGSALVKDPKGQTVQRPGTSVALCRCGHSQDKPFCDGRHNRENFRAPALEFQVESGD